MADRTEKEFALSMLQTLSALEALVLACGKSLPMIAPDYLLDDMQSQIETLRKIILKGE